MPISKTRVAIVGGGVGGVSAAFWLSASAALRERFEVTIYTHGWRLGGKCASGRNAAEGDRIEEHGLHLFLGFYETAFATMRAAYALTKEGGGPFRDWTDAFKPQRLVSLGFQVRNAGAAPTWSPWTVEFPRLPGEPGDPEPEWLLAVIQRVIAALRQNVWPALHRVFGTRSARRRRFSPMSSTCTSAVRSGRPRCSATSRRSISLSAILCSPRSSGCRAGSRPRSRSCCGKPASTATASTSSCRSGSPASPGSCATWCRTARPEFDRINDRDFRTWLQDHGAPADTVGPGPIQAIYDLAFAYKGGEGKDPAAAQIAAGAALRVAIKLVFGYRDAPLWRMQAGAGDVIFTPLYRLSLRSRREDRVLPPRPADPARRRRRRRHRADRQLDLKDGEYRPFRTVKGLDCWPSEPLWEQIVDGEKLAGQGLALESPWCGFKVGERTLRRGVDFDLVVLAVPPLALAPISEELAQASADWKAMLDNSSSVPTQSLQLWMKPDLTGLGWQQGSTVLTSSRSCSPLWADMTHLIARENHAADDAPSSCHYFCGTFVGPATLPTGVDPDFIREQTKLMMQQSAAWLDSEVGVLWPTVCASGTFDAASVVQSYYRVNLGGSEQYVLTLPGTVSSASTREAASSRERLPGGRLDADQHQWRLRRGRVRVRERAAEGDRRGAVAGGARVTFTAQGAFQTTVPSSTSKSIFHQKGAKRTGTVVEPAAGVPRPRSATTRWLSQVRTSSEKSPASGPAPSSRTSLQGE